MWQHTVLIAAAGELTTNILLALERHRSRVFENQLPQFNVHLLAKFLMDKYEATTVTRDERSPQLVFG